MSIFQTFKKSQCTLCEKCPDTEFFWSIFSCIRTEYGGSRSKSLYSVLIRENTDQKNFGIWTLFTRWKLNALNRMKVYIGKKEMEMLINSFVCSNLNYCFLVLHFTSCKSTKKIEKIHQRCLRILLNDYVSDRKHYQKKSDKCLMETQRLRILSI